MIKFSNGKCWQGEIVCDKPVDIVSGIVLISNHSDVLRIVCRGTNTGKTNVLIANDSGTFVNLSLTYNHVFHVILGSGYKECMLFVKEILKTLKVHIALIHQIIGECFNWQFVKGLRIKNTSIRQINEGWDVSTQIKKRMHLEDSLVMMVLCPWTMFETQLNSTAIKSINHFIKTKPEVIFRVELLCSLNQTLSKVMIDSPIFLLIHLTECRARDKTQTCVVKLLLKCSQYRLVSLKTLLRCELSESHNHKLDAA